MSEPGPCGCFQLAPFFHVHHCETSFMETGVDVDVKTRDEACNCSSSGFGVPAGNCFFTSSQLISFSAVVMYPVASTKFLNCAFVTSVSSIQNPSTLTLCCGYSSGFPSSLDPP